MPNLKWNKILTKSYLREAYKTKSCSGIAQEVGCSHTLVHIYLKRYGIPRRQRAEAISRGLKKYYERVLEDAYEPHFRASGRRSGKV